MKELSLTNDAEVFALQEKRVMQHNAITSGRFDFSACQLDILFMLLATLKDDELTYRVYAKDIERITGRTWNYQQLRDATENIGCRMFEIETDVKLTQLWLFQKVEYHVGEGCFDVMISEAAKPYFFELKNNFTSLQLKAILGCSSKYAKRLYSLGCQWRSVGRVVYTIEDLKKKLGLIDKKGKEQYVDINKFKERVLDVSKQQINDLTDITFDYVIHKKGRSFHSVEILINTQLSSQLQIDFKYPVSTQLNIRTLMAYGLTEYQSLQIAQKETLDNFNALISELKTKTLKGVLKAENATSYIVGIYKKKGIIKD